MTTCNATNPDHVARTGRIDAFLSDAGWGTAAQEPLAGDASSRRYVRLGPVSGRRAILMDADPARGEDVRPFVSVARHLGALGFSAPAILAEDRAAGLLILEDLGDDLFARLAPGRPDLEHTLYAAAIDLLAELHHHRPIPGVPRYGPDEMADLADLATHWYARKEGATRLAPACRAVLQTNAPILDGRADVLVLRDYHAENLIWLPDRADHARVGLLDFQDAASGHPAYDLVSLLCDARRDVPAQLRADMTARYLAATGRDRSAFAAACAVLGAQRNLRILGVFARLSLRDGKPGYIDLIPRVWAHLQRDLAHPACAPLKTQVAAHLPEPSAEVLDRLRGAGR